MSRYYLDLVPDGHWDGSFEYLQHMFLSGNDNIVLLHTLI